MNRIRIAFITLFVFAGVSLHAQVPEGATTALNYSGLENRLKKSDSEIQDPKKNIKIKTWTNRAELLLEIYNVHNDVLRKGMDPASVQLFFKEPKEIQTTQEGPDQVENYIYDRVTLKFVNGVLDSWTETKKIHPDPLGEAKKAIDEAIKLNTDGKLDKDIQELINNLKAGYEMEAVTSFDRKDFQRSYDSFKNILGLNELDIMKGRVDTIIFYYAGRAALENNDCQNAIKMFEKAGNAGYEDPFFYVFSKQAYFACGDTASGVKVIDAGFEKYPDNQSIMIELINYYLLSNQADEALQLLAKAKASDPENVSYTFAEGTLYDKMGRFDDAEKAYKTCLEMKSDFFDASYNLGVLYFNKAVKIYEDASRISDNTEYEKIKTEGDEMLEKSIPYMEKAHEIDQTDRSSLETLKTIFYRLQMNDKYDEVVKKLNEL
jgi:tetratricopeptide (TPR) repeat protein